MNKFNIIDTFSISNFIKEDVENRQNYEVKAALFLTYSLKPKVILALLRGLFYQDQNEEEKKNSREESLKLLDSIVKDLLEHEIEKKHSVKSETFSASLKDKFAVFYNNGSRSAEDKLSIADALAMKYSYAVDMGNSSFHPKVYIVKYGSIEGGRKSIYRIMIGSHNLSQSNAIEYGYCFDRESDEIGPDQDWDWLGSLLTGSNDSFCIMDQCGTIIDYSNLPVISEITTGHFSGDNKLPEIITDFTRIDPCKGNRIFSPFLSANKIRDLKADIYTTAFELKKKGFIPADCEDNETQEFWIFTPEEGTEESKYAMPHYKVYHLGERAYTGSLNYTQSAFTRNKEVLVELPEDAIKEFEDQVLGWYSKKRFIRDKNQDGAEKTDIYEGFRNWIRKNLSADSLKISLQKRDHEILLKLEFSKDFSSQDIWEEIRINKNEGEKAGFAIFICPENMTDKRQKIEGKVMEWTLDPREADRLRSSTLYFYLNDGDREYPPCCRIYQLSEGVEILSENEKKASLLDFMKMRHGDVGTAESDSGVINGHGFSIQQFRSVFSLYSLNDILATDPANRKNIIERMKLRVNILKEFLEGQDDTIFEKLGCLPADRLVWKKLVEQSRKVVELIQEQRPGNMDSGVQHE